MSERDTNFNSSSFQKGFEEVDGVGRSTHALKKTVIAAVKGAAIAGLSATVGPMGACQIVTVVEQTIVKRRSN